MEDSISKQQHNKERSLMKIYKEIRWQDFDFNDKARENMRYLTDEQIEKVWEYLETYYPEGLSYHDTNNFFTYNIKSLSYLFGFDCWEQLVNTHLMRKRKEYITQVDTPIIIYEGEYEGLLYCARIQGYTTMTACEKMCPHHSSCDNIADMDDIFKEAEYFGVL